MSRARLRVGVPEVIRRYPPQSSAGRIWRNGLEVVGRTATVVVDDPRRRLGRLRRRVDVWLTDGHQGPLDVRVPVVAHLHEASWSVPELRPLFEPGFLEQYEAPSAAAAAAASVVLTVSRSSAEQIVREYGVPEDRVVVAHNGVDHDVYRPGRPGAEALIDAAGGDGRAPYVLFVSTLHPRKNLAALRGAMAELARRGLPHRLVLVAGPAPDRAEQAQLEAAATAPIPGTDAPVVNLAGVDDASVAALMSGAAAFCLPSLMEGFGMAVAEAMACGAPVVVSDTGALPEVVGSAGVVCEPTVEALAEALHPVLTDPHVAARLRARSLARARDFSWSAMGARWCEALDLAVSAPARQEPLGRARTRPVGGQRAAGSGEAMRG